MWEYKIKDIEEPGNEQDQLEVLGKHSWELVHVRFHDTHDGSRRTQVRRFYFKRPLGTYPDNRVPSDD